MPISIWRIAGSCSARSSVHLTLIAYGRPNQLRSVADRAGVAAHADVWPTYASHFEALLRAVAGPDLDQNALRAAALLACCPARTPGLVIALVGGRLHALRGRLQQPHITQLTAMERQRGLRRMCRQSKTMGIDIGTTIPDSANRSNNTGALCDLQRYGPLDQLAIWWACASQPQKIGNDGRYEDGRMQAETSVSVRTPPLDGRNTQLRNLGRINAVPAWLPPYLRFPLRGVSLELPLEGLRRRLRLDAVRRQASPPRQGQQLRALLPARCTRARSRPAHGGHPHHRAGAALAPH